MRFIRLTRLTVAALLALTACGGDDKGPSEPGGNDGTITTIQITPTSPSVDEGGTVTLAAVAKNAAGETVEGTSFTWTSANTAIATVGQTTGVVTGVLAGTTQVTATGGGKTGTTTVTVTTGAATTTTTAIAYTRGGEIRLIDLDGRNDRNIWTQPYPDIPSYTVKGLVWKPDGTELAFSSNHEQIVSFYDREIYAVRPDGSRLRKLTNGPKYEDLASFPQGIVTARVTNLSSESGPFVIYVVGAREPQAAVIAPGSTQTFTFPFVADFGDHAQAVVAIYGGYRWFDAGAAPDVKAGQTVNGGTVTITGGVTAANVGAVGPAWRSDGAKLGFLSTVTCILYQVSDDPPPGYSHSPLLDPDVTAPCTWDYSPPSVAGHHLLVTNIDFDAGEGHIHRLPEGSSTLGPALVTFPSYDQMTDMRWLPDGSGFLFAKGGELFDESIHLFEHTFATGSTRQVTSFAETVIRGISISPDGQFVAFERAATLDGPSDIWVMRRDGSDPRLLVQNGTSPAWNPLHR
jgi:TolB protein